MVSSNYRVKELTSHPITFATYTYNFINDHMIRDMAQLRNFRIATAGWEIDESHNYTLQSIPAVRY